MTGESGFGDVYLDKMKSDTDRAVILAMFFKDRYEAEGMRGRQATAVGAGIKHHFAAALKSVDWFESHIVTSARAACRMTCDELRGQERSQQPCDSTSKRGYAIRGKSQTVGRKELGMG